MDEKEEVVLWDPIRRQVSLHRRSLKDWPKAFKTLPTRMVWHRTAKPEVKVLEFLDGKPKVRMVSISTKDADALLLKDKGVVGALGGQEDAHTRKQREQRAALLAGAVGLGGAGLLAWWLTRSGSKDEKTKKPLTEEELAAMRKQAEEDEKKRLEEAESARAEEARAAAKAQADAQAQRDAAATEQAAKTAGAEQNAKAAAKEQADRAQAAEDKAKVQAQAEAEEEEKARAEAKEQADRARAAELQAKFEAQEQSQKVREAETQTKAEAKAQADAAALAIPTKEGGLPLYVLSPTPLKNLYQFVFGRSEPTTMSQAAKVLGLGDGRNISPYLLPGPKGSEWNTGSFEPLVSPIPSEEWQEIKPNELNSLELVWTEPTRALVSFALTENPCVVQRFGTFDYIPFCVTAPTQNLSTVTALMADDMYARLATATTASTVVLLYRAQQAASNKNKNKKKVWNIGTHEDISISQGCFEWSPELKASLASGAPFGQISYLRQENAQLCCYVDENGQWARPSSFASLDLVHVVNPSAVRSPLSRDDKFITMADELVHFLQEWLLRGYTIVLANGKIKAQKARAPCTVVLTQSHCPRNWEVNAINMALAEFASDPLEVKLLLWPDDEILGRRVLNPPVPWLARTGRPTWWPFDTSQRLWRQAGPTKAFPNPPRLGLYFMIEFENGWYVWDWFYSVFGVKEDVFVASDHVQGIDRERCVVQVQGAWMRAGFLQSPQTVLRMQAEAWSSKKSGARSKATALQMNAFNNARDDVVRITPGRPTYIPEWAKQHIIGGTDVAALMADPANHGAIFQVLGGREGGRFVNGNEVEERRLLTTDLYLGAQRDFREADAAVATAATTVCYRQDQLYHLKGLRLLGLEEEKEEEKKAPMLVLSAQVVCRNRGRTTLFDQQQDVHLIGLDASRAQEGKGEEEGDEDVYDQYVSAILLAEAMQSIPGIYATRRLFLLLLPGARNQYALFKAIGATAQYAAGLEISIIGTL